jgi:putative membrane protein
MKCSSTVFATALLFAAAGAFAQGTAPAAAPAAAGPTDAQIAHIVVTANQVDIDAGRLAAGRGHVKAVRAFGKQMIADHTGVNKEAVALANKLNIKPEDNPTSKSLKAGGVENVTTLKGLKRAVFDRAYIEHEVKYHEQVLDAIDKVLIPNAKNAELKALIVKVRPAFVGHLEQAKKIQGSLKG